MRHCRVLFAFSILLSISPAQAASEAIANEKIYLRYQKEIGSLKGIQLHPAKLSVRRQRLALDAAEDLLLAGRVLELDKLIALGETAALAPKELARWHRLKGLLKNRVPLDEIVLVAALEHAPQSPGLLYELLRQRGTFRTEVARELADNAALALPAEALSYRLLTSSRAFTAPAAEEARKLWEGVNEVAAFKNGEYANKPRLFMFCRHNRRYKCLLAMRDKHNEPVRSGTALWAQPSLGLSAHGLPFNVRNGYTPSGVHLINGVMPEANFPLAYGKNRRLILDFVPSSSGETEQKKLLPASSHASLWWKEAMVARDIGRGELRIHGTGETSEDPEQPYYPFVPTIGCVAQRELKYGETVYNDQRLLLDLLMRSSGLSAVFANEPGIKGLLYVLEIDDAGGAVTAADLRRLGIL